MQHILNSGLLTRALSAVQRFARDEKGVTTLEYGILAAGIAVVIGALVADDGIFANTVTELFQRVLDALPSVSSSSSGS